MPTIDIKKKDLDTLIGKKLSVEALEKKLMLAKAELKEYNAETDELKVELSDSNRPDLWSAEGLARQIRIALSGKPETYPFFKHGRKATREIRVSKAMKGVRPYIAACTASGMRMNEDVLAQMIQSQDKLSEIFGRKRSTVSIGIYELDKIAFPVDYRLAEPSLVSFMPLGMDRKLTLAEILDQHPKGIAYGGIVKPFPAYPVLTDNQGRALSFPPIINSAELGEVKSTTRNVLIEVTGTELRMTALTLNILAANFYDRGADIEPVLVTYPYATELGRRVAFPYDTSNKMTAPLAQFSAGLGEDVSQADVQKYLSAYGHRVAAARGAVTVFVPPYRDDIMHPMDLVEDYAISRGYDSFEPIMPRQSTVGSLSQLELLSDTVRGHMVGSGFQDARQEALRALQARLEVAGHRIAGHASDRLRDLAQRHAAAGCAFDLDPAVAQREIAGCGLQHEGGDCQRLVTHGLGGHMDGGTRGDGLPAGEPALAVGDDGRVARDHRDVVRLDAELLGTNLSECRLDALPHRHRTGIDRHAA